MAQASRRMMPPPVSASFSSPKRFSASSEAKMLPHPVTLPPGCGRLATSPTLTGSLPTLNTIGIVVVAALAASEGLSPPR